MTHQNVISALIATSLLAVLAACAGMPSSSAPVKFSGGTLVNTAGMTLYSYDRDTGGKSACSGACAAIWPPLKAAAEDKGGGDFSIIARDDGSRQWAYDGKPLYLWSKDAKPGDKTGDGFNKVWHVVGQPEIPANLGGY